MEYGTKKSKKTYRITWKIDIKKCKNAHVEKLSKKTNVWKAEWTDRGTNELMERGMDELTDSRRNR